MLSAINKRKEGQFLSYFNVEYVDEAGRVVPDEWLANVCVTTGLRDFMLQGVVPRAMQLTAERDALLQQLNAPAAPRHFLDDDPREEAQKQLARISVLQASVSRLLKEVRQDLAADPSLATAPLCLHPTVEGAGRGMVFSHEGTHALLAHVLHIDAPMREQSIYDTLSRWLPPHGGACNDLWLLYGTLIPRHSRHVEELLTNLVATCWVVQNAKDMDEDTFAAIMADTAMSYGSYVRGMGEVVDFQQLAFLLRDSAVELLRVYAGPEDVFSAFAQALLKVRADAGL